MECAHRRFEVLVPVDGGITVAESNDAGTRRPIIRSRLLATVNTDPSPLSQSFSLWRGIQAAADESPSVRYRPPGQVSSYQI